MRERLFVQLSTVVMRIIFKSFEVSARKITQSISIGFSDKDQTLLKERLKRKRKTYSDQHKAGELIFRSWWPSSGFLDIVGYFWND